MGLFNIFRVCSALFLIAALGSAHANYIYDNRTGTWTPTARTVLAPPNATSPFNYVPRDSPPTVSSTGAFQNKTGGTFGSPPVNGTSKNVPVTINGTTTKPNVNKALLSRLGKGGLAGIALGAGIDALLDGIGALIDDAGNVSRTDPNYVAPPVPPDFLGRVYYRNPPLPDVYFPDPFSACSAVASGYGQSLVGVVPAGYGGTMRCLTKKPDGGDDRWDLSIRGSGCYTGFELIDGQCMPSVGTVPVLPFPLPELEDAINSGYNPDPSDYPFLSSDPAMQPTIVEVEPISRLDLAPTTTTTVDLDTGKTTTVTTNIWHDFNVKDNNSDQPKIEAETTTKSDTYVDGEKTGESTTVSNSGTASGVGPVSGSGEKLEIDIPTDCDFMPTVCAFLEWYKDDDLGDDPDLASIMKDDEEFAKTKVISFGAAVCPQPYTIHISSLSMSADLSFEFFCQFAEYARALVLAAAYIFAAYISLGVARG